MPVLRAAPIGNHEARFQAETSSRTCMLRISRAEAAGRSSEDVVRELLGRHSAR